MNILEEIKNNLKNKGLKQGYIAEQLNISKQSFWYKLQNNTFKTDELFKLAKILGINLNKFKEVWEVQIDEQKPYSYVTLGEEKLPNDKELERRVRESYKRQKRQLEEKLDDLESDYRIFWGLRGWTLIMRKLESSEETWKR